MPDVQQLLQDTPWSQQWPPAGLGQLLNPMPLVRGALRGVRDIGVGGANAGLDMAGVPKSDFQSPIQNWIDRQLAEPNQDGNMQAKPQQSGHMQHLTAQHAAAKAKADLLGAQVKQAQAMQQMQQEQMMQQQGVPPGIQGQGMSPAVMQMLMGGIQR